MLVIIFRELNSPSDISSDRLMSILSHDSSFSSTANATTIARTVAEQLPTLFYCSLLVHFVFIIDQIRERDERPYCDIDRAFIGLLPQIYVRGIQKLTNSRDPRCRHAGGLELCLVRGELQVPPASTPTRVPRTA
jgi:hypothetical protein